MRGSAMPSRGCPFTTRFMRRSCIGVFPCKNTSQGTLDENTCEMLSIGGRIERIAVGRLVGRHPRRLLDRGLVKPTANEGVFGLRESDGRRRQTSNRKPDIGHQTTRRHDQLGRDGYDREIRRTPGDLDKRSAATSRQHGGIRR